MVKLRKDKVNQQLPFPAVERVDSPETVHGHPDTPDHCTESPLSSAASQMDYSWQMDWKNQKQFKLEYY